MRAGPQEQHRLDLPMRPPPKPPGQCRSPKSCWFGLGARTRGHASSAASPESMRKKCSEQLAVFTDGSIHRRVLDMSITRERVICFVVGVIALAAGIALAFAGGMWLFSAAV